MHKQTSQDTAATVLDRFEQDLVPLALRGLKRMILSDQSCFCHKAIRGNDAGLTLEGDSERYSAMVLIGLTMQEHLGREGGIDTRAVYDRLIDWCKRSAQIGDVGLVLSVLSISNDQRAEQMSEVLANRWREMSGRTAGLTSMSMGWLLTGASLAMQRGYGMQILSPITQDAAHTLLANRDPTTHLFSLGGATRRNIFRRRLNSRLGSFASQVYPTLGFAYHSMATGDGDSLRVATETADAICRLQGPDGQWWWIYDRRVGTPVIRYPVYGVHQDAMGPMALLAVSLANEGARDYQEPIRKSLEWLWNRPEMGTESLVEPEIGVVWRAIQRDDPSSTRGFGLGSKELRRMQMAAWSGITDQRRFSSGYVCHECRPYHLGWILVAGAMAYAEVKANK